MNSKIVTVYCQHGNERFGTLVAAELAKYSELTLLGNPKALMKGTRFIDTDLNRSYNKPEITGYESRRAQAILRELSDIDIVIDIHSSKAKVGKVAILPNDSRKLLRIAIALGFERAVIMPRHIVANSLIGSVSNGISVEYGSNTSQSLQTARGLAKDIHNLDANNVSGSIAVYKVKDLIRPEFKNSRFQNYKYSQVINGYPFLVGEPGYKGYIGFFADSLETVIIGSNDD